MVVQRDSNMGSILNDGVDEMLPVHAFDDTALNRVMLNTGLIRYRAVLDGVKLSDALENLFQIGEWKKLRGRLRLNVSLSGMDIAAFYREKLTQRQAKDKLEIHVPLKVTPQRPAIRYKQTALSIPIDSHPGFSQLAQTTRASGVQPAIAGFPDDLLSILVPQGWPRTLQDYVDPRTDEPIFGLHVITFTDTTLVVLKYSHVIMDGGGSEALMRAWSNVLRGRGDLVPPLGGARNDPLDTIRECREAAEPYVLADKRIESAFLMPDDGKAPPSGPDWDTSSPESRWRTISLSPDALTSIIAEAKISVPIYPDGPKIFVSEDDMVTAWLTRTIASALPEDRPINLMRIYDMRNRLPVLDSDTAYVQNAFQMAWTLFPSAGEASRTSLGVVAARLRAALLEQTTEAQVAACMAERDAGAIPLYGDPTGVFFTLNSWAQAKLYQAIDLSPAVVGTGEGLPDLIDFDFALGGSELGPNIISSGKDARGARHAMAFLSNVMWPKMEDALSKLG